MNDLIKSSIEKEDEPESSPVNPALQLKPEFETMLHQIQAIKDIQLNGINLFLFTGIQNHDDYKEATNLLKRVRSECERIHQIQEGAQVPDLVQLIAMIEAVINNFEEDEDDDDDDDDLEGDGDEDFNLDDD